MIKKKISLGAAFQFQHLLDDLNVKYVKEYLFAKTAFKRSYRFDFALVERKIAFEIDGGTFSGGRHVSPIGFNNDHVKFFLAAYLGWKVFRISTAWFTHHKRKKSQKHLIFYEDLEMMLKKILA